MEFLEFIGSVATLLLIARLASQKRSRQGEQASTEEESDEERLREFLKELKGDMEEILPPLPSAQTPPPPPRVGQPMSSPKIIPPPTPKNLKKAHPIPFSPQVPPPTLANKPYGVEIRKSPSRGKTLIQNLSRKQDLILYHALLSPLWDEEKEGKGENRWQ